MLRVASPSSQQCVEVQVDSLTNSPDVGNLVTSPRSSGSNGSRVCFSPVDDRGDLVDFKNAQKYNPYQGRRRSPQRLLLDKIATSAFSSIEELKNGHQDSSTQRAVSPAVSNGELKRYFTTLGNASSDVSNGELKQYFTTLGKASPAISKEELIEYFTTFGKASSAV